MASQKISLLLADVDGTLVDSKKVVTPRALEAIRRLGEKKIDFAVTSGRPPRGMRMITDAISMTAPVAAFNGGMIVRPNDLSQVIESHTLDGETARQVMARLDAAKLDVWVYAALNWYLRDTERAAHRQGGEHGPIPADGCAGLLAGAVGGACQR